MLTFLVLDGVYDHKVYTEKSLARMVKAKAKAERAAARQAQHVQLYAFAGVSTPSSSTTATPAPASGTATPTPADSPHEADEPPNTTTKESPPDRTEMLRGKPEVVGRFMQLIVPILVDVYAASVITTVRIKTFAGLLKAISYLEADDIKRVLTVSVQLLDARIFAHRSLSPYLSPAFLCPFCHPRITPLVIGALKPVEMLRPRSPRSISQLSIIYGLLQFPTDKTRSNERTAIRICRNQYGNCTVSYDGIDCEQALTSGLF